MPKYSKTYFILTQNFSSTFLAGSSPRSLLSSTVPFLSLLQRPSLLCAETYTRVLKAVLHQLVMSASAVDGAAVTAFRVVVDRVQLAAAGSSRRPDELRVVAVSKTKPTSLTHQSFDVDHRCFGENYVQEILQKPPLISEDIDCHFVGHLQRYKVKSLLVTGGAGYVGSHTALQLLLGGFKVAVIDIPSSSSETVIQRVAELAGELGKNLTFYQIDLRDKPALENLFASTDFDAVIHIAGLKSVSQSLQNPLLYYSNNVTGTINLLEVMASCGCKKLVFSSSATVYGWPKEVPCSEDSPVSPSNPYARTKLFVEQVCHDLHGSDSEWKIIILRYFNPVGAHPSGQIGEDSRGTPHNLLPFIQHVAEGKRSALTVFGNDYSTNDGTGVRDYIHIVDLANGHLAALGKLFDSSIGCEIYNLGTGKGTSVIELVSAFEKASGKKIPLVMAARRAGDAEIVYASTDKAACGLNWRAEYGIDEMCRDQWNFARKNPFGYVSANSSTT